MSACELRLELRRSIEDAFAVAPAIPLFPEHVGEF